MAAEAFRAKIVHLGFLSIYTLVFVITYVYEHGVLFFLI